MARAGKFASNPLGGSTPTDLSTYQVAPAGQSVPMAVQPTAEQRASQAASNARMAAELKNVAAETALKVAKLAVSTPKPTVAPAVGVLPVPVIPTVVVPVLKLRRPLE